MLGSLESFDHDEPGGRPQALRRRSGVVAAVPDRLERIIASLVHPGAVVVLLGEGGSGRHPLAQEAGEAVAVALGWGQGGGVELPEAPHETSGVSSVFSSVVASGEGGPEEWDRIAERVLGALIAGSESAEVVLVAPNVDRYGPRDARVLELVLRDPRVRAVATARQLTTAVERLSSGPQRTQISVAPFDLDEANVYLSALLGVDRVETETLRRWFDAARGNSYALAVLALSSEGAGSLRRSRGVAWSTATTDDVPSEYARILVGACTPEELDVLELVALAEPVTETVLLRSMDAACLSRLFERGLVVSRPHRDGLSLVAGHPLLGSLVRAGMSPVRRLQLNDHIFRTLSDDLGSLDPLYAPDRLMRLVVFGIEGGRHLPFPWLWAAFEQTVRGGAPCLVLNLALAVTTHPGATVMQAGSAALRAYRFARLLGDDGTLRAVLGTVRGLLGDPAQIAEMTPMLRGRLESTLIEQGIWDDGDSDAALAAIDALAVSVADEETPVIEAVRSLRVTVLAYTGRLREAGLAAPDEEVSTDLKIEWVRSPARALTALILEQQGAFRRALAGLENSRTLSRLGPRARPDVVDMHGFGWLLAYWMSGSAESATQALEELVAEAHADAHSEAHYSGLVEAGAVLIGVQEGRWAGSAQDAERLMDRFARHDSYGLMPLVSAALALALAVLGEREGARRAIRGAGVPTRGMGQVLSGHRRLLVLRAHQWLAAGDAAAEAGRLVTWARGEGLPMIELEALHVIAVETRAVSPELLARARHLADTVDPPLPGALLAHIERIADGAGTSAVDTDEPEVRMLAELGVWLPLPPAAELTAREREVALLASLGHSSKFIAERLHISVRTVETHLSNVFSKTGVASRDELGQWAARDRAAGRGAESA